MIFNVIISAQEGHPMKQLLLILLLSSLALQNGCSNGPKTRYPYISQANPAQEQAMTYEQYRAYVSQKAADGDSWAEDIMSRNYSDSSQALQHRFLILDQDNNGRLSAAELGTD